MLDIRIIGTYYCKKCGAHLPDGGEHCFYCLKKPAYHFEFIRAAAIYEGTLRKLIHKFKYQNRDYLARFLGLLIAKTAELHFAQVKIDYIIPIPMHWLKRLYRGYNQSELLAKSVAKQLKIPMLLDVLKKKRYTQAQIRYTREKRIENVKNCFFCTSIPAIKGSEILLIDDVCTSGATMEECAKTLKKAGAHKVYGLSVARD